MEALCRLTCPLCCVAGLLFCCFGHCSRLPRTVGKGGIAFIGSVADDRWCGRLFHHMLDLDGGGDKSGPYALGPFRCKLWDLILSRFLWFLLCLRLHRRRDLLWSFLCYRTSLISIRSRIQSNLLDGCLLCLHGC